MEKRRLKVVEIQDSLQRNVWVIWALSQDLKQSKNVGSNMDQARAPGMTAEPLPPRPQYLGSIELLHLQHVSDNVQSGHFIDQSGSMMRIQQNSAPGAHRFGRGDADCQDAVYQFTVDKCFLHFTQCWATL